MSTTGARLLFVIGKGGVGRSTTAAAFAVRAAASGSRVLVVDATAAGGTAAALGLDTSPTPGVLSRVRPIGVDGRRLATVTLLALSTEASLDQYMKLNLRLPIAPRNIGPIARIFDYVAVAAPAVREILTIGKIAHEVRRASWDLVIVDAPATGHVVELLSAPTSLAALVGFGPLANDTAWMSDMLADDEITSAVAVTLAEELPTTETIELIDRVRTETDVTVSGLIVNRVPPSLSDEGRSEAERLVEASPSESPGESPRQAIVSLAAVALYRDLAADRERARLSELGVPIAVAVENIDDPLGAIVDALDAAPEPVAGVHR